MLAVFGGFGYNGHMATAPTTSTTMKIPAVNIVREQTARLLATENISVIQDAATSSAYFDLKTRTLCLPVWTNMSNEMYDMLVGHEVGHALFTPNDAGGWVDSAKAIAAQHGFAGIKSAEQVAQSFLNVVEDARIERLIKERFPGLRRDFFTAYTAFSQRDIFQLKGRNPNTLPLPDRLNLNFKIGFITPIAFTPDEQQFVDRTAAAVTWQEVVSIASDLFAFEMKKNEDEDEKQQGKGKRRERTEDGEGGEGEGQGGEGEGQEPDSCKGEQGEQGEAQGQSKDANEADGKGGKEGKNDELQDANGKDSNQSGSENREGDAKPETTPASKPSAKQNTSTGVQMPTAATTADSLDRASSEMRDQSGTTRDYIHFPKNFKGSEFVVPYGEFLAAFRAWEAAVPATDARTQVECQRGRIAIDKKLSEMIEDTKSSVSAFASEFERRKTADEHHRTVESKSGRLDMDQAWKYKIADNLFRTATSIRDGKSHGFVMFIDWSGSMSPCIEQTMRQLFMLFQFCKKVGIPFDVYAFGVGINDPAKFPSLVAKKSTQFDASRNEVKIVNNVFQVLSSTMSTSEMKEAFRCCLQATMSYGSYGHHYPCSLGGSTPLESCIVIAADLVKTFKEENKLQIVNTVFLTDGEATDHVLSYGTKSGSRWNAVTILRDGKNEIAVEGRYSATATLIKWLKGKVGGNIVGIFVAEGSRGAGHYINTGTEAQRTENTKSFKTNGWCAVPNGSGYDQYFILRGTLVDTEAAMNSFESEDLSALTPAMLKSRFLKAVTSRNGNRGMIQRFVTAVA